MWMADFFYQLCEFVGESTGIEAGVGSPSIRFRNGGYCTGHQTDFLRQQSPVLRVLHTGIVLLQLSTWHGGHLCNV